MLTKPIFIANELSKMLADPNFREVRIKDSVRFLILLLASTQKIEVFNKFYVFICHFVI